MPKSEDSCFKTNGGGLGAESVGSSYRCDVAIAIRYDVNEKKKRVKIRETAT